jgi:hypothetical protein
MEIRHPEFDTSAPCPNGKGPHGSDKPGTFHRMEREVRDHPTLPGKQQDRMACSLCDAVLYGWKTFTPRGA